MRSVLSNGQKLACQKKICSPEQPLLLILSQPRADVAGAIPGELSDVRIAAGRTVILSGIPWGEPVTVYGFVTKENDQSLLRAEPDDKLFVVSSMPLLPPSFVLNINITSVFENRWNLEGCIGVLHVWWTCARPREGARLR